MRHGELVAEKFKDLMSPERKHLWVLPGWFQMRFGAISERLITKFDLITTYQTYHDIGKPFCRVVDESGRAHYPNHADISAEIWNSSGKCKIIGELISRDMEFHLLKPSEILDDYPIDGLSLILLITALCEIHANAEMFGGLESDSFKIKWKRLDKIGNRLIDRMLVQLELSQITK